MKTTQHIKISLSLALGAFATLVPSAKAGLVSNGDFSGQAFASFDVLGQGFGAWTVLGDIDPQYGPAAVTVFPYGGIGPLTEHLDLGGFTDRIGQGVEQQLATNAGQQYRLTFDYWTGGVVLPGGLMDVFLNGSLIANNLNSGDDDGVRTFDQTFTATGLTTLTFLTASNGLAIDIDNVNVEAVPDSLPLSVFAGSLLLVLTAARRRGALC